MKKLIALLLVLILAACCAGYAKQAETGASDQAEQPAAVQPEQTEQPVQAEQPQAETALRLEGPGYATPEEAVLAYIDAMNRGDMDGMLSTFAVETYTDHVIPELWLRHNRAFNTSVVWKYIPVSDDYVRSLISVNRYSSIIGSFKAAYLLNGLGDNTGFRTLSSAAERRAMVDQLLASPLYNMAGHVEFVRWISPVSLSSGTIAKPGAGGDYAAQTAYLGADDITELFAELRINGALAVQPMQCARYGSRWYNLDYSTRTASMSPVLLNPWQQPLWMPAGDEEKEQFEQLLSKNYPEETARWDAIQQSGWGGTRWPLVSLSAPDVTVCDSASAAGSSEGAGVWAEIHFNRMGGALVTVTASPALRERLGMEESTVRIAFSWFADEIPTVSVRTKMRGGKEVAQIAIPLFKYLGSENDVFGMESLTVERTDTAVTLLLADGTEAVFRKPAGAAVSPAKAEEAGAAARLEGAGYDTPEDAVLAYLDALNRGDARGMLATFALETYAAHADPMFNTELLNSYKINASFYNPFTDDFSRSLLAHDRFNFLARGVLTAWASYAVDISRNTAFKTNGEIQAFMDQFSRSPLKEIAGNASFTNWLNPLSLIGGNWMNLASAASDLILSGADDVVYLAAQFTANGHLGILPMRCVRYGDRWYNDWPESRIAYRYIQDGSGAAMFLWLPDADETAQILKDTVNADPETVAMWNAVRQSDLGGTRWKMTALNSLDVTVADTADEAESGVGKAVSAEIVFSSIGGGYAAVTGSPALQEALGMDGGTARIIFSWHPASGSAGNLALEKNVVYPRLPDNGEIRLNLDGVNAVRDGGVITITLADGTRALFRQVE